MCGGRVVIWGGEGGEVEGMGETQYIEVGGVGGLMMWFVVGWDGGIPTRIRIVRRWNYATHSADLQCKQR